MPVVAVLQKHDSIYQLADYGLRSLSWVEEGERGCQWGEVCQWGKRGVSVGRERHISGEGEVCQ